MYKALVSGALALVALEERVAHVFGGPAPIPECLSSRVPQVLCEPGTLVLEICPGTVCTVEVCVVFLDTLTPVFELYVRLRERRQRAATCWTLVRAIPCETSVRSREADLDMEPYWV
ncbi:hypothetical protein Taro_032036, partial [Colocasia esculenta]|nr:hypothetical protein [Colocasia esculenta]